MSILLDRRVAWPFSGIMEDAKVRGPDILRPNDFRSSGGPSGPIPLELTYIAQYNSLLEQTTWSTTGFNMEVGDLIIFEDACRATGTFRTPPYYAATINGNSMNYFYTFATSGSVRHRHSVFWKVLEAGEPNATISGQAAERRNTRTLVVYRPNRPIESVIEGDLGRYNYDGVDPPLLTVTSGDATGACVAMGCQSGFGSVTAGSLTSGSTTIAASQSECTLRSYYWKFDQADTKTNVQYNFNNTNPQLVIEGYLDIS